ncbi:MAG: fluoride efflux transporter CrcB [Bacteroidota bacterium]|nr:fluoride efflux transporter CrcB [Ferruginibacter sp.]
MLRNLLLIGLGGALGSILRYGTSLLVGSRPFPWATFIINITGSFLIGLVMAYSLKNEWFNQHWKLFLATGFCGGFTTFSTFSLENIQLLQEGKWSLFAVYSAGSLLLGIMSIWLAFKFVNSV